LKYFILCMFIIYHFYTSLFSPQENADFFDEYETVNKI